MPIGLIYDSRNVAVANNYAGLIGQTAYAKDSILAHSFLPSHIERNARVFDKCRLLLAPIGLPGLKDYAQQLHGFMESLTRARRIAPVGFFSHDEAHTRHVLQEWLHHDSQRGVSMPAGVLHIIDASRRLNAPMLESALDVLAKSAKTLPTAQPQPLSHMTVETLTQLEYAGDRNR